MNSLRRSLLSALGVATLPLISPLRANAERAAQLPTKITILVGFPPGGGTDLLARHLADGLREQLRIPVVVLNRPGAGGQIAAQTLMHSKADGSVLLLSHDHTISIFPQLTKNPGYNPMVDFRTVAGVGNFVNCFFISTNVASVNYLQYRQWLLSQADANRTVGIPAINSTPEYLVKRINRQDNLDLVAVPYQGSAPMLSDVMAGHIPAAIGSIFECIEHQRSGRIRIIGVMGSKRLGLLPNVPTFSELGISGFEKTPFYGLFVPQKTPLGTCDTISLVIKSVLSQSKFIKVFASSGIEINWSSSKQFSEEVLRYNQDWQKIFQESQLEKNFSTNYTFVV
jgi:tripartite-type tricarboxylate transporter receptor subunit TctC